MPIPFRDRSPDGPLGLAGFLRFVEEPNGGAIRAALFLIDQDGGPVDFCFSRATLPRSLLWGPRDLRRRAIRELSKVLFAACSTEPTLLLGLATEIPAEIFASQIEVSMPLGLVTPIVGATQCALDGAGTERVDIRWLNAGPLPESKAQALIEILRAQGLLTEPFTRAVDGLEDACKLH